MRVERGAWLEIDSGILLDNYRQVKNAVDDVSEKEGRHVKFCAVLKANAYGLGTAEVAKLLEKEPNPPDCYAVACLSEALEIRAVNPAREILILGYVAEDCYDTAIANAITLPMYREDALKAFDRRAGEMGMKGLVHIAVNSGMNRIGFLPTEESADVVATAFRLPNLEINGVFTHFAIADEADKAPADMQMKRFESFLDMLTARGVKLPTVHAGASPTICDMPWYFKDMVRSGLTLPGFYASDDVDHEKIKLRPAVKLKAKLGNAMPVKAGEGIGYGFTYHLPEDTVVGLVPLGFSDGVPRSLSNDFYVTVRGIKCPQIGRICMDHFMIDLNAVPDPVIGEEVVIYGDGPEGPDRALGIMDVANKLNTIPDEILTVLAPRVPRIFL